MASAKDFYRAKYLKKIQIIQTTNTPFW